MRESSGGAGGVDCLAEEGNDDAKEKKGATRAGDLIESVVFGFWL